MADHDRLFKDLLTTFLGDFLRLFAPALAEEIVPDTVEILNTELGTDIPQASKRVVDVLARFRFRDSQDAAPSCVLVRVENQASPEDRFEVCADEEKVMELTTSWMEKGIEPGRAAEALRLVVAQLHRRIGPLPPTVEDRVNLLSLQQLEALSVSLLDLGSISELEAWLSER